MKWNVWAFIIHVVSSIELQKVSWNWMAFKRYAAFVVALSCLMRKKRWTADDMTLQQAWLLALCVGSSNVNCYINYYISIYDCKCTCKSNSCAATGQGWKYLYMSWTRTLLHWNWMSLYPKNFFLYKLKSRQTVAYSSPSSKTFIIIPGRDWYSYISKLIIFTRNDTIYRFTNTWFDGTHFLFRNTLLYV